MHEEIIRYKLGEDSFQGFLVCPDAKDSKRPAIIVAHAWRGLDDFAKEKARELAQLGYVAFAADVYGNGKHVDNNEEAPALMLPLFKNRKLLRERICAAYNTVASMKNVDRNLMGAIGFCFGGLTVIELLRSGVELRGVVSFHGLLGDTLEQHKAVILPISSKAKGSLLILHGNDDPMVSKADIDGMQKEMTKAGIDWQMHIYGHTSHAFTNPMATDPANGMVYNPVAAKRSWKSMRNFFEEIFSNH